MVEAFPRGGKLNEFKSKKRKSEETSNENDGENLFKTKTKTPKLKTRKSKSNYETGLTSGKKRQRSDSDVASKRRKAGSVYRLRFKNLRRGNLLFGTVTQIGDNYAVLSLPNNLSGIVSLQRVFDGSMKPGSKMTNFLKLGDYYRCAVFSVSREDNGKERIELSLQASLVNENLEIEDIKKGCIAYGNVKSFEDHGYVVSLGIGKATGFLSYKIAGGSVDSPKLNIGQPVEVKVLNKKAPFKFSNDTELISGTMLKSESALSINSLHPGVLVEVNVEKVLSNGLKVRFLEDFTGSVELSHLDCVAQEDWMSKYSEQEPKQYKARVIYVDPENKGIGLSMASHIVKRENLREQLDSYNGKIIDDAEIVRIVPKSGIVLKLKETDATGFVGLSQIEESKRMSLAKNFEIGKSLRCRCLFVSLMDKTLHVSSLESVINAKILTFEDLKPGMNVDATVVRVGSFGIVANIGNGIKALIPLLHLSDVNVSDPERRFRSGQTLKAKVLKLSKDASGNKIQLTLKKSLIRSELPILADIQDASAGVIAHGYITSIRETRGIHVSFFGDVHGLIHSADLKAFGITHPETSYKKGEVVKVRVVENLGKKLKLSLRTKTSGKIENEESADLEVDASGFSPGCFIAGTILRIVDETNLLIRVEKDNDDAETRAILPVAHLSDHPSLCEELLTKCYRPGKKIDKLLVLELAKRRRKSNHRNAEDTEITPMLVSLKPKLISLAENGMLPGSLNKVHEEKVVTGYISKIGPLGVFVKFLSKLTALAPRANISDEWVNDPNQFFTVGQTVQAQVVHVNSKLNKFIITLKASVLNEVKAPDQSFLKTYLAEKKKIADADAKRNKKREKSKNSMEPTRRIGEVALATVLQTKEYGLIMELEKGGVAFCMNENAPTELPKVGSKVECRILDVEPTNGIIDVSLRATIVNAGKSGNSRAVFKDTDEKTECRAVVEIIKPSHAVISLPELNYALALVPLKDYNGKIPGFGALRVGLKCMALPSFRMEQQNLIPEDYAHTPIMRLVSDSKMPQKKIRARSESYSSERVDLNVGSIVRVQVRDIQKTTMNANLLNVKRRKKYKKCFAKIHCSEIIDPNSLTGVSEKDSVFSSYCVGSIFDSKVVKLEKVTEGKRKGEHLAVLSLRPSEMQTGDGSVLHDKELTWENITELDFSKPVIGYINKIVDDGIIVDLSRKVRGFVYCTNVSNDLKILEKMFNSKKGSEVKIAGFHVASPVRARIIECDVESRQLNLTLLEQE